MKQQDRVRLLLIQRMAVRRPAVLKKLLAMIGDNDNQSIAENAELFEFFQQRSDAAVVVGDLGVIAVPRPGNGFATMEAVR